MDSSEKREIVIGIMKGTIGAIPVAGNLLNEVLFDIRGRIKQQRFSEFVGELSSRIEKLEKNDINDTLIRSEEFGDLLESVLHEITKKKMHQNLSILADVTIKSMGDSRILQHPMINSFLEVIASLTSSELLVIQKLRPFNSANQAKISQGAKEIEFKIDYSIPNLMGFDNKIFRATFDSLLSKAIVIDDTIGRYGGGQRDYIKPSQFGIELFKFLDEIEAKEHGKETA